MIHTKMKQIIEEYDDKEDTDNNIVLMMGH